ncbi:MAG: hypothetical protein K2M67_04945 [Muribaculaceae bacterium]|nr:hypothetical protein [Muribaculaceae bacterium]
MVKTYSRKVYAAAFAAMMVATGVSAFADANEVELSNGTTITWDQFVSGVNNPNSVVADINTDEDPAVIAAKQLVETKKGDVTTAEKTLTEKEAAVAEGSQLIKDQTAAATALTEAQAAQAAAEKQLTDAQQELSELTAQQGTLNTDLTSAQGDLTQATSDITTANDYLNNVENYYTESTPATWLATIQTNAKTFKNAFESGSDAQGQIYYTYTETTGGFGGTKTLNFTISYVNPANDGVSGYYGPLNYSGLVNLFMGDNGELKGKVPKNLYVYLGPEYAAKNPENGQPGSQTAQVTSYNQTLDNLIDSSVAFINSLAEQSKYGTTTKVYFDATESKTYQDLKTNAEKNRVIANNQIAKVNAQLKGGTYIEPTDPENITVANGAVVGTPTTITAAESVNGQISAKNAEIRTLNNTTIPAARQAVTDAQSAKETADAEVTAAKNDVATAQAALTAANDAVTTAEADVTAAVNKAQDDANAAERAAYQDVTLKGDITIDKAITATYTGTIDGDNNIITVATTDGYGFKTFSGNLSNVAINGTLGDRLNNASFSNVIAWRGSGKQNTYYPTVGTPTTYTSLGALGYAVRDEFGVDFAKSQIAKLSEETIVYNITVNNSATQNTQAYVVNKNSQLIGNGGNAVTIPQNRFAKSADALSFNNVYYADDNNNLVCANAVITDKVNFYCPEDITATSVEYTRTFSAGLNAVTLPFEVSKDNFAAGNVIALSTFDRETPEKFFFTIQTSNPIPANTPMLLVGKEGVADFTFTNLQDVAISKTTQNIVSYEGANDDNSKVYGNFIKATRSEMAGESQGFKVYGLSGGKFVVAGESATFAPFRMAVASGLVASQSEAQKAPRSVAFLDEKGVEVGDLLTGIDSIVADEEALAFDIVAGQGEIIFTSDSDFGKVEVYTLDGKVAAAVNVTEGTTSVNVQKGLYIVMGKKLVVR